MRAITYSTLEYAGRGICGGIDGSAEGRRQSRVMCIRVTHGMVSNGTMVSVVATAVADMGHTPCHFAFVASRSGGHEGR